MANHSGCENLMNNMKRQNDLILEDEPPRSEGIQMLLGKSSGNY